MHLCDYRFQIISLGKQFSLPQILSIAFFIFHLYIAIFNIAIHSFQVKQLYNKVNGQAESLKGLWVAKLNLKDRSALATPEDLLAYDSKKQEVNGA